MNLRATSAMKRVEFNQHEASIKLPWPEGRQKWFGA